MEIMLVRHTEIGLEPGIVYGRTDVPLAATFDDEKLDVATRVAHFWPDGPTWVVSSPATRAKRLAEHLVSSHENPLVSQLPIRFDDRLLEVSFGAWEMRRWDEIDRVELDAWMSDFENVRPPSDPAPGGLIGENVADVAHRAMQAFNETIAKRSPRTLMVCHGALIRVVLASLLEMPLRNCFSIEIDKGSVSRVKFRGDDKTPILLGVNYR
jgi:alpha-ribazole phosphatase